MTEQHQLPEDGKDQQTLPTGELDEPENGPVRSRYLLELSAFPASLKEQPWFKEIVATLEGANDVDHFHVTCQPGRIDLDGLGQIEVRPTTLKVQVEAAGLDSSLTLTIYDVKQQYPETVFTGHLIISDVSISLSNESLLKVENANGTQQGIVSYRLQVQSSDFMSLLSLSPRNLWWLEPTDGRQVWKDGQLAYLDPRLLLEDLTAHLDRFVAEAGVVGYRERQMKKAAILFALGQFAQIAGLYEEASSCYGKSANKFRGLEKPAKETEVLRSVKDLYLRQGLEDKAKIIDARLLRLTKKAQ